MAIGRSRVGSGQQRLFKEAF